jgi:hypothetical protein
MMSYVEEWMKSHLALTGLLGIPVFLIWLIEFFFRAPRRNGRTALFSGRMFLGMKMTPEHYRNAMWLRDLQRRYGFKVVGFPIHG